MNILIMSKIFAQSGVGSHIMDLTQELIRRGNNVWIISGTNDHEDWCAKNQIQFCKNSFSLQPQRFVKNVYMLQRFIKENKIQIVHCHHRTCGFYMQVLSKLTGIPFVWSNHLDNIPSDFIHRATTFYGKQAICVSTDLRNFCHLKLGIPENNISVVLNGIRPENYHYDAAYVKSFKEQYQVGDKRIFGLFARMAPIKGHQCMIEAVEKIAPDIREKMLVVFFGGGESMRTPFARRYISVDWTRHLSLKIS